MGRTRLPAGGLIADAALAAAVTVIAVAQATSASQDRAPVRRGLTFAALTKQI